MPARRCERRPRRAPATTGAVTEVLTQARLLRWSGLAPSDDPPHGCWVGRRIIAARGVRALLLMDRFGEAFEIPPHPVELLACLHAERRVQDVAGLDAPKPALELGVLVFDLFEGGE